MVQVVKRLMMVVALLVAVQVASAAPVTFAQEEVTETPVGETDLGETQTQTDTQVSGTDATTAPVETQVAQTTDDDGFPWGLLGLLGLLGLAGLRRNDDRRVVVDDDRVGTTGPTTRR